MADDVTPVTPAPAPVVKWDRGAWLRWLLSLLIAVAVGYMTRQQVEVPPPPETVTVPVPLLVPWALPAP